MLRNLMRHFVKPFPTDLQERIFKEALRAVGSLKACIPLDIHLPAGYGMGMPERVVEILLARLSFQPGLRVLDVGHAHAMRCHLNMLKTLPGPRHLTGIDIATPAYDTWEYYERSVRGDITAMPFADQLFDLIWCISAIEHFGMDNSAYFKNPRRDADADAVALREMLRLLKAGGTALITVPYGKYENHGWFRQYDAQTWQALLAMARRSSDISEAYFRHTASSGWQPVGPDELRHTSYYDELNSGAAGLAVAFLVKKATINFRVS